MSKHLLVLFACSLILQACFMEPERSSELKFEQQSDRALSVKAFKDTVHPLLKASCAGCHGDSGSQAPKHAVSDAESAHDAVIDTGRVNFQEPAKSRLVKRLSDDGHYCWSDCDSNGDQMLAAIEEWKNRSGGLGGVEGQITASKKLSDAKEGMAETINGTVVFQAEDGKLSGRFKVKVASQASGLKYIAGDQPPVHPVEATNRTGSINSACYDSADLSNSVTGPFRISEARRHVNEKGYQPYSSRVTLTWIDPDQRDAYEDALRDPNITDYTPYFFADDDDGDMLLTNSVRVLPDFVDAATFNGSIRDVREPANASPSATYSWDSSNHLVFDFFKPRFGGSGTEYFFANTNQVINGLPDYVFSDVIYDQISNRIRDIFEDANQISDIPDGMRVVGGVPFDFSDKANEVTRFYNHFMDGLTSANALDDETGGIRRIDRYVHYEVPVASRQVRANVNWDNVDTMNLNIGNQTLDLNSFFTGGSVKSISQIRAETYHTTLKRVFAQGNANCVNCHADGSDRPQYAAADIEEAYNEAAAINGFLNFDNPNNARPVQRMLVDRHQCGSAANCDSLGADMIQAIEDWEDAINAAVAAQASNDDNGLEQLSSAEKTPGKAEYRFRVTEAGEYNVWIKLMAAGNNNDSIRLRIKDAEGNEVSNCRQDTNGFCRESDNKCRDYNTNARDWEWFTPEINNENRRWKWDLAPGIYTLELFERDIDAKIDLIAINKNPEFNPAKNLIDEGFIQDLKPKTMRYNLASLFGNGNGFFEIDVRKAATEDSYVFRNPRFVDGSKNIRFRNIKVLVNGSYEASNSTYSKLDRVTEPNSGILTFSTLVVLEVLGSSQDEFAFVFEDLQLSDLPASELDEDAPVAVEGRPCLELGLFEQSVMPILNRFRLALKEDYMDYTSGSFPGRNGDTADNITFYTCTTCHNEEHPYFKMTTFFDNSEVLCQQALSRVDFGNFERSLLLRGINGTFNHPKLHFVQDVAITGSGTNRRFVTDDSDASGFDSTWKGNRYLKYTEGTDESAGEIDLSVAANDDERDYLRSFLGTYQKVRYLRYRNVQSPDNGAVLTEGGSETFDEDGIPQYNQSGRSMYEIINPEDFLADQNDLNPNNPGAGVIAVDRDCMGVDFTTDNGTMIDPSDCGGGADYTQEFENVKSEYRQAVINWMNAEKRAYQNQ